MSIYTKTGDNGTTGLFGGTRVGKDSQIIDVLGNIDELNASIGILISTSSIPPDIKELLLHTQNKMFEIGTIVANPAKYQSETNFNEEHTNHLELLIDKYESLIEPLSNFILPGGCPLAANLHLTRAICRKLERSLVTFRNTGSNKFINELKYLNRLSDLLFVLARFVNKVENVPETIWRG